MREKSGRRGTVEQRALGSTRAASRTPINGWGWGPIRRPAFLPRPEGCRCSCRIMSRFAGSDGRPGAAVPRFSAGRTSRKRRLRATRDRRMHLSTGPHRIKGRAGRHAREEHPRPGAEVSPERRTKGTTAMHGRSGASGELQDRVLQPALVPRAACRRGGHRGSP